MQAGVQAEAPDGGLAVVVLFPSWALAVWVWWAVEQASPPLPGPPHTPLYLSWTQRGDSTAAQITQRRTYNLQAFLQRYGHLFKDTMPWKKLLPPCNNKSRDSACVHITHRRLSALLPFAHQPDSFWQDFCHTAHVTPPSRLSWWGPGVERHTIGWFSLPAPPSGRLFDGFDI